MTEISAKEMEGIVGPDLAVTGPVAGFGIHYKIEGKTDISSPTAAVDVKLNEGSLENAEKASGVSRSSKSGAQLPSSASKKQAQSDNAYANVFDKKGLSASVEKGTSIKSRFSSRPNYRSEMSSQTMSPLARVRQRRLLELRRTFDQIAAQKKKAVPVNAESLPKATLERMVKEALNKGQTVTAVGSLSRTMKLAGMDPKDEKKKQQKKRQWALFVDPNMIPSGWAMD